MGKGPLRHRSADGIAAQKFVTWLASDTERPDESTLTTYPLVGGGALTRTAIASSAVTNDTAETAFDVTATIPAGVLAVGSVIKIKAAVEVGSTNSTDTLIIALRFGGVDVLTTATVNVEDNDVCLIDATLIVKTIGATGTARAFVSYQDPDVAGTAPKMETAALAAIDFTDAITIDATAKWSVKSTANSCTLEFLLVEIIK